MELDLIQTLAFGGAVLLAGYGLRRVVPILARYNLPAPVIGGLVVAIAILAARHQGVTLFRFDTTLQSPLMIVFFTTIGFGASVSLLRVGGPLVLRFFLIATIFAVVQNAVGILIALPFGLHPLFGVLAGSVTLTGGPATGLAFAPLFEQAGVAGAASIAVAAAMGGIIAGGLVGGPVSTLLIERYRLFRTRTPLAPGAESIRIPEPQPDAESTSAAEPADEETEILPVLRNVVAILVAMWAGAWVSKGFAALGLTLPAYIGAMLVAAALRNLDDFTGWLRLWPVFQIMGRDYEAAVTSGGFIGFMLGTTANAMAVMRALVERYGPAPTAFLVAPMVGAFFMRPSGRL